MPLSFTGSASENTTPVSVKSIYDIQKKLPVKNSCSIVTASLMMIRTVSGWGWRRRWLKSKHAKYVCMPSSRLISSFEKVRPDTRPRFFIQKMEAKGLKKYSLHGCKCHKALSESGPFVGDPFECQLCLAINARYGFDCII